MAVALAEHGREWFFVRYADPLPQLRLRVRDEGGGAEVSWLLAELAARVDDGVLARFEVVGYERELERYGGPAGLDCCERLFCAESLAVVRLIELAGLLPADSDVDSADLALLCADTMLAGLGLDRAAVVELTGRVRRGYAEEFAADPTVSSRALNRELNARRGRLRALLGGTHPVLTDVLRDWASGFRDRICPIGARLGSLDGELTQPVEQILPSLLHLHANRLGLDRHEEYRMTHRLHEVSKDLCHAKVAP
ncbi:MAG: thiopeptide-type bacteriocin biosynthesis protein [Sciscionella sp.]